MEGKPITACERASEAGARMLKSQGHFDGYFGVFRRQLQRENWRGEAKGTSDIASAMRTDTIVFLRNKGCACVVQPLLFPSL